MLTTQADALTIEAPQGPTAKTPEQIRDRMDAIGELARQRMEENPPSIDLACAYGALAYMTLEEIREMHELKLALPSQAEEREAAKKRIAERIAQRRMARAMPA